MIYAQAIKELIFKQIYVPLREKVIKDIDDIIIKEVINSPSAIEDINKKGYFFIYLKRENLNFPLTFNLLIDYLKDYIVEGKFESILIKRNKLNYSICFSLKNYIQINFDDIKDYIVIYRYGNQSTFKIFYPKNFDKKLLETI